MDVRFTLEGGPARSAYLTVGNFDGVHRGHRKLLDLLVERAHDDGAEAVVLTFEPHPRCVLDPGRCPQSLTTLDEKRERLAAAGVDRLIVLPFTPDLSRWPPEKFCAELVRTLDLRGIFAGPDFALGHDRAGDIPFLRRFGRDHGFDVEVAGAESDGAAAVSSARIRAAIIEGDVAQARVLLGHPYFLDGVVEPGDRIGSEIGFPTANLSITPNKCLPARGVYAIWARVRDRWRPAAASVGFRPTFGGDRLTVEAFILDFAGDIYREKLRIAFVARLREERMYSDIAALTSQIAIDVEETRRILGGEPVPTGI